MACLEHLCKCGETWCNNSWISPCPKCHTMNDKPTWDEEDSHREPVETYEENN